jgi:hypothetical protein
MGSQRAIFIGKYRRNDHQAEYPAFSAGENFSPDTVGHMSLIPMRTAAAPGGSHSEPLFARAF